MSISVVIPYYNNSDKFLKCIESVINQKHLPDEVIIIDDCSDDSDNLRVILDNVESNISIHYIRNNINMNGAVTRNKGIEIASMDYVALLDADDYWDENHLLSYAKSLYKYDFLYSNKICIFNGEFKKVVVSDVLNYNYDNICNILLDSPPQTNSFVFNKSCFPYVKFDESLTRHQDYQFFVDFFRSGFQMKKLDIYTSFYNVPNSKRKIKFESIVSFWHKNLSYVDENKIYKFSIDILCQSLRVSKCSEKDFILIKDSLLNDSKIVLFSSFFKSSFMRKVIIYPYFYLFVDRGNLLARLRKLLRC